MFSGDILDGFCGISRRQGKKPIISAVNGFAFGLPLLSYDLCTGRIRNCCELVYTTLVLVAYSSDIVISSTKASFALPEVKRGVFAKSGALARIVRFISTSPRIYLRRTTKSLTIGVTRRPCKSPENVRMGNCK